VNPPVGSLGLFTFNLHRKAPSTPCPFPLPASRERGLGEWGADPVQVENQTSPGSRPGYPTISRVSLKKPVRETERRIRAGAIGLLVALQYWAQRCLKPLSLLR
jgi:hypothetical protein